jgi:uncharacterized membrane protein YedE/YeeE
MTDKRTQGIAAGAVVGLLFGAGLIVGGMTQPSKVIGFLDFAGDWDPSLAFVMGGAIAVYLPLLRIITKGSKPLFGMSFSLPTRRDIDGQLVLGAALFGIGWGLAGYCPGPAFTAVGSLAPTALLFASAMVFGFGLKRGYDALRARRSRTLAAKSEPVWEK